MNDFTVDKVHIVYTWLELLPPIFNNWFFRRFFRDYKVKWLTTDAITGKDIYGSNEQPPQGCDIHDIIVYIKSDKIPTIFSELLINVGGYGQVHLPYTDVQFQNLMFYNCTPVSWTTSTSSGTLRAEHYREI